MPESSELVDQGDGAVQAGEAAGAATVAGRHVDAHPLAAGLDRLLGAGILAQQAVEALTGLTARLYPDSGLHLAAEAQIQRPGGTGSGAAATVAALAAGEIQHRGAGYGGADIFGLVGGFEQAVGAGFEALAAAAAQSEELRLFDGPVRASASDRKNESCSPLYLLGVNFIQFSAGKPENSAGQDRKPGCPCVS